MRYGKPRDPKGKWHHVVGDRARCFESLVLVEFSDDPPSVFDDICGNCDDRLREAGKMNKPPEKTVEKHPTVYIPKNRYRDG